MENDVFLKELFLPVSIGDRLGVIEMVKRHCYVLGRLDI